MATAKKNPRRRRKSSASKGRKSRRRNSATASVKTSPARAAKATRNPAKSTSNPRRRRRGGGKRRNPAARARRNPARPGVAGEAITLLISGIGVAAFNRVATNLMGPQAGVKSSAIKVAGGYALSAYGKKLPLVGKYSSLIGAALMTIGAYELVNAYVWPQIDQIIPANTPLIGSGASSGASGLDGFTAIPPAPVGVYGVESTYFN